MLTVPVNSVANSMISRDLWGGEKNKKTDNGFLKMLKFRLTARPRSERTRARRRNMYAHTHARTHLQTLMKS